MDTKILNSAGNPAGWDMNILFIIVASILVIGAVWGWKRGLLESVIRIISCILGIFVLVVAAKGVGNFIQKSYVKVIMAVILLLAIRMIHRAVKFLTDTFRLVRAIPVGKLADKLAGAVLGLAEAVIVIWLMFLIIGIFDIMGLKVWMIEQVSESSFLTMLYYSNYLIELLKAVLY
ncbi:MAG: CvpA family protein [Lachnospiraceae bacterium]|nr:CvpA family protein [Lachnospiraceae bacterium]